jgi:hypothetical protein
MIFRRIRALGGDWVYHFPELGLVDIGGLRPDSNSLARYSPNEALAAERKAQKREAEIARLREDLEEINTRAREDAMDRLMAVAAGMAPRYVGGEACYAGGQPLGSRP